MDIKLYEILPMLSKMESLAEDENELKIYLDSAKLTLNQKVDNIVKFERGLRAGADAIDTEIARLNRMKATMVRKAENLKQYVSYEMTKNGINKIETDIAKLSFRRSERVIIVDEKKLPKKFIRRITTESFDRVAIKKALKDGKKVKGAEIKENFNLQIK